MKIEFLGIPVEGDLPEPELRLMGVRAAIKRVFSVTTSDGEYQPTVPELQAWASDIVQQQATEQYDLWQSAYASYGDGLAVTQAIESALRATRRDALDAIEAATTVEEIETVLVGLTWPPVPDQAEIDADVGGSLAAKQQIKDFIAANPQLQAILALPIEDQLDGIAARNATQETIYLQLVWLGLDYLRWLTK